MCSRLYYDLYSYLGLCKHTFAQRRNRLTTHFSERIAVVKRRIFVSYTYIHTYTRARTHTHTHTSLSSYHHHHHHKIFVLFPNFLCCSMYCFFCRSVYCVCVCVRVLYYCHRVATELQSTNKSYYLEIW